MTTGRSESLEYRWTKTEMSQKSFRCVHAYMYRAVCMSFQCHSENGMEGQFTECVRAEHDTPELSVIGDLPPFCTQFRGARIVCCALSGSR